MKIGLIYPAQRGITTYRSTNPMLQGFFLENEYVPEFFHPSLSLLTIAALTPPDIDVKLIDERISSIDYDEHFDLIGISIMTEQAFKGYEIAQKFRERGVTTVIGGIHATILPEEAEKYSDAVVVGEAENTWSQVLRDFRRGHLRKFYKEIEGQVDLQKSPVPRYKLLDLDKYRLIPIQTTRGCPYDCNFCAASKIYGPKFRNKPTAQVIEEIETVLAFGKNRRIVFNDDNMFVNRKRSYELLEAIIPLKIKYFVQTDISIADDDKLLNLMGKSGCVSVFLGLESLLPENLEYFQKSKFKFKHLGKYKNYCQKIHSHGIQILGCFMVGCDFDGPDVFERLVEFTLDNNILGQYLILTPFPATRLREELIKEGRLAPGHSQWNKYTCLDVVFEPKRMDRETLEEGILYTYRMVYSRNAHLKRVRHMVDILKSLRHDRQKIEKG